MKPVSCQFSEPIEQDAHNVPHTPKSRMPNTAKSIHWRIADVKARHMRERDALMEKYKVQREELRARHNNEDEDERTRLRKHGEIVPVDRRAALDKRSQERAKEQAKLRSKQDSEYDAQRKRHRTEDADVRAGAHVGDDQGVSPSRQLAAAAARPLPDFRAAILSTTAIGANSTKRTRGTSVRSATSTLSRPTARPRAPITLARLQGTTSV